MNWRRRGIGVLCIVLAAGWVTAGGILSYEGSLTSRGLPGNGYFDFRFSLHDGPDPASSEQVGKIVEMNYVSVFGGRFDVDLDFGPEIDALGTAWLEIEVARSGGFGGYTLLEPRQPALEQPSTKALSVVPSNAVVFFNLAACPLGWVEHTETRGRTVVGMPEAGTLNATIGANLSDLENRYHAHNYNFSGDTDLDGDHNHIWSQIQRVGAYVQWQSFASNGTWDLAFQWENGVGNEGSGYYPLSAQPDQTLYTSKGGNHTHGFALGTRVTQGQTSAFPYVQLLACRKE